MLDYFSYLKIIKKQDTKENFASYLINVLDYDEEQAKKDSEFYYNMEKNYVKYILKVRGHYITPVLYTNRDMTFEDAIKDYLENEAKGFKREDIIVEYLD